MNLSQISLAFIFLCFLIIFNAGSTHPTHFTDDIVSINCGSTATSSAYNGRQWLGDVPVQPTTSQLPLLQLKGSSSTSTASSKSTSADRVPYKTARVSRSRFSYAFRVNSGQIIIRLHFNPSSYRGFKGLKDLFTVEADSFILLGNFSASLTADVLRVNSLTKEYCLNIQENQILDITFSAETSQSKDVYAFINGIEIISVPATLSYFQGRGIGLEVVGRNSLVYVDDSIALEMIYRQNIKQADDSGDIFGVWPRREVGNINNVSWKISVDVGFRYLVRLHFSKLGLKMAETGGLNFKVFINEMIADTNIDLVTKGRDGTSIPWYGDYMAMMSGRKLEGKRDLLIRLQTNDEFTDGILKGFEILKLSNPDNSLASPIPMPPSQDSTSQTFQKLLKVLGNKNAIGSVVITILSLVCFIVHKLREISEASSSEEANRPSARAERLCRCFSLAEMQLATRNFSDGLIIGRGGFGKVYKGLIDNEKNTVAVKRLKSNSNQGAREFLTEIETLSELRHINLVSLVGYCSEYREMILVYEYMACGTLGDHLYNFARRGIDASSLTWKQRLNICIGAARGLDYLHTGHRVIHRDVKTSNILLDVNFVAKVSDFGLAKAEDRSKSQSHVSTKVKGTYGYLDPYYYSTRKLTRKSDIYAFGVVLLEVLCGRPAVDSGVPEDEHFLITWARNKISKGEVDQIVDSSLRDEISAKSQKTFVGIIERCLNDEPKRRPTMSQVVLQLELALGHQDSNKDLGLNEIANASDEIHPSTSNDLTHLSGTLQPTVKPINMQNLTLPPNEQSNNKVNISGKKHRGKSTRNKTQRLWLWDVFWNRVKPSNKYESFISDEGLTSFKMVSGEGTELSNLSSKSSASIPPTSRSGDLILQSSNLKSFTLSDLKAATRNFRPDSVIGEGGFGSVFKGWIDEHTFAASRPGSGIVIAVKRLNQEGWQGHTQWLAKINYLGQLHHPNLVKLIGYCLEDDHRLLVYEFMPKGSMYNHLFRRGSYFQPLSWSLRMSIALGAARGLAFLHSDAANVIFRDFNASNILLDSNYNAKLSDFGSARDGPTGDNSHVSTRVLGTYGYAAPEYLSTGRLTAKSDVYSFGVALLEILSGKKAIDKNRPSGEHNLVEWAKPCLTNKRRVLQLLDSRLEGQQSLSQAIKAAQLALQCLSPDARSRPSMDEVVKTLEQLSL